MKKLFGFLLVLATAAAGAQSTGGSSGVKSINGARGPFTFNGSGVSCSGTTCTFSSSGGGDTITSPNSTLSVGGTSSATTLDLNLAHTNIWSAQIGDSAAVAASTPPIYLTGALCGATCSGTTTFPVFFHQPTGTAAYTGWSNGANGGTIFGANEAASYAGNFMQGAIAGTQLFFIDNAGQFNGLGIINVASANNSRFRTLSTGGQAYTNVVGNVALTVLNAQTTPTADLLDLDFGATPTIAAKFDKGGNPFVPSVNQMAASSTGGTCTMTTTSCTITIGHTYTTPVCIATEQGAGALAGSCGVSGTTVTITAASSNTGTWGAFVFGNPN